MLFVLIPYFLHVHMYVQLLYAYFLVLMDESRLNNTIRQKINYALRDGDPLPNLHSSRSDRGRRIERQPPVLLRPGSSRRRTYSEIISSGAYERDKFVPDRTKEDREVLKSRLQNIMANGKESLKKPVGHKKETKSKDKPELNRFDERKNYNL